MIHKIKTVNNLLVVDWILSNVCNYKCTYCGPDSNGGDQYWPDMEQCEEAVRQITAQSHHDHRMYTILGGEPTVWKEFSHLVQRIKEIDSNSMINILTNASRTIRWWNKTKQHIDKVSISFHHESADPAHIIKVVEEIQHDCQTNIQMLMDINHFDKCVAIWEYFRDNTVVPIQIKKLQVEFGGKVWMDYTQEQRRKMLEMHQETKDRPTTKRNITSLGINVHYDNGEVKREGCHDLIQAGINKFEGWKCNVGRDLVVIKANGDVVPANACNQQLILGNIKIAPDKIKLLAEPIICAYRECTCGSDIEIDKQK
jgi:MoaA/NifB/PqqE/SkfB family radical SAM enzyme